jgi:LPXTG-motif cell wall-anchored protein
VTSDAFVTLWTAANRAGHNALVSLLTGEDQGKAVTVSSNGAVMLNLGPIIEQVKARLVTAGLGIAQNIPTVGATIEIARLQGVDRAQQVVRWLNTLANWLPWIGLVLLAGAVALARGRRRRALLWAALSTAIGMVLLRLALVVLREVYLDQMPTDVVTPQASAYIFDTVTRFLRDGIRLIFLVALVVALIAVLLGQRALLARAGGGVTTATRGAWDSLRNGPVGAAVADHTAVAAGAVVALGALVLVLRSNPTGLVVLVIAIIVALLLAAVYAMSHRKVDVGLPAG